MKEMGVEKFIRQLPLVIAIILMISNCESANDQYGGSGGSGYAASGEDYGPAGGGYSDMGSAAAAQGKSAPDPTDSVSVQMPQQEGNSWVMASVRLKTMTKLDIYQRLTSYYQDLHNQSTRQSASAMLQNHQQMQMQFRQLQAQTQGMPPMGQMNVMQLQQYAQSLTQQVQFLQMTNQQLQMKLSTMSSEEKDDTSREEVAKEEESKPDEGEETSENNWKRRYEKLVALIPAEEGETPEDALKRLLPEQDAEQDAEEDSGVEPEAVEEGAGEEEAESGEGSEASALLKKGVLKSSGGLGRASPPSEEGEEATGDTDDVEDSGSEAPVKKTVLKKAFFNPAKAPIELTDVQEKQLTVWRGEHEKLMERVKCPDMKLPEHLTPAQQWAFFKHAFKRLHAHVGCS